MLRKLFSYLFLLLNLLAIVWLGCCFAASFTSPLHVRDLQLFSLSTPFAIITNALFLICWLFSAHKSRSLVSLIALGICYKLILALFAFNFFSSNDMSAGSGHLKVMHWNVHGFGIFDGDEKTRSASIFALIRKEQPDILCMPEYYVMNTPDSSKPYTNRIMQEQGLPYSRFICDNTLGTKILLGTAIFSRYPIIDYHVYQLSRYIFIMRCDVQLPGKRIISVYATHLHSFMLSTGDRGYLEAAGNSQNMNRPYLRKMHKYRRKFNWDYAMRAFEADSAASVLKHSPYPILLCGDFNDLPASYTYTTMRGKLHDAFIDKGLGIGDTYNQLYPTLRIDYILYEATALKAIGYTSPNTTLSDHDPVIANFEIKR